MTEFNSPGQDEDLPQRMADWQTVNDVLKETSRVRREKSAERVEEHASRYAYDLVGQDSTSTVYCTTGQVVSLRRQNEILKS